MARKKEENKSKNKSLFIVNNFLNLFNIIIYGINEITVICAAWSVIIDADSYKGAITTKTMANTSIFEMCIVAVVGILVLILNHCAYFRKKDKLVIAVTILEILALIALIVRTVMLFFV